MRPFTLALVLQHPEERSPRRSGTVAAVRRQFHQALRVEVFDRYEIAFPSVVHREFVQEVPALSLQVGVTTGHDTLLLAVVRRPVVLLRKVALCAFQPLAFVGKVGTFDGGSVAVVSVLQDTHVDPDALLGVLGFRWRAVLGFDAEDSEPLARRLLLDDDLLDRCVVGNLAVVDHRNVADLGKREHRPTARVVEFEAGLTVLDRAIFLWGLPPKFADTVAVVLPPLQRREIVVQSLYDLLKHFRVNILQVVPLAFEVGKERLFGVGGGSVYSVEPVKEMVVDLSADIDGPR